MLVTQFVTQVKRKLQLVSAQTVITDADIVAWANRQLQMVICPKILSVRQNYFLGQKSYPISGTRYRLPPRILGNRITIVKVIDGNGGQYTLTPTSIAQKANYRQGYYIQQGDIVLTGQVPSSGVIVVWYPIRPPLMSATATAVGTVLSSTTQVNASLALSGDYEIIRSGSPYRTISPKVNFSGSALGYDSDYGDEYNRFAAGDIIITANSTHIVPLEEQLCDWLSQRTAMRALQALGHSTELGIMGSKLADIEKDSLALISPRVQDQPKVVIGMQALGWRF